KEAAYNQIKAVENDRAALDTIPAILGNSFVQQQKAEIAEIQRRQSQLADNLGPNHPEMRKVTTSLQQAQIKVQAEIVKVVPSIRLRSRARPPIRTREPACCMDARAARRSHSSSSCSSSTWTTGSRRPKKSKHIWGCPSLGWFRPCSIRAGATR